MNGTVEKIEKLFDRFNVWELLGENYWAILIADRPEYVTSKHLKVKSVDYDPLIVMESNKHIYSKKLGNEKKRAISRLLTAIKEGSKQAIIRKHFTYINTSMEYCCLLRENG